MLSPERTYRQITRTAALARFVLNLILVNPAAAQSNDSTNIGHSDKRPRFHISVDGIYSLLETNIRFESQNSLLGAKINLEEVLGFDKSRIMPMFMATFNIKNRHSLLGIVYSLPRDSYIKTEREFEYNGNIIEIGTEINSYYNTNVFSVGYLYDVVRDSKAKLGLFVN
jgi:hypothetical protein